jgi:hypothetical protein
MMAEGDVEGDEGRLEVESRISEWMKKSNEKARCTCTYTFLPGNTGDPKWQTREASPLSLSERSSLGHCLVAERKVTFARNLPNRS